ncbi:hypothetical protein NDU88_008162 [Pleurodeles waltl]|uniref:Uncharacterized protein n=1 Tax=Pleurodeles waltl TaxID=8319 RepID=A0AAV7VWH3_PLEWA|nr:hypothetical protein NDU88_008162 [Pleurodeles waltl]
MLIQPKKGDRPVAALLSRLEVHKFRFAPAARDALTGDGGAQDQSPQVSLPQEAAVVALLLCLEAHKFGFASPLHGTRAPVRDQMRPDWAYSFILLFLIGW